MIMVLHESNYCCVTSKLDYVIRRVGVMTEEGVEKGAQHTALWYSSTDGEGGGVVVL